MARTKRKNPLSRIIHGVMDVFGWLGRSTKDRVAKAMEDLEEQEKKAEEEERDLEKKEQKWWKSVDKRQVAGDLITAYQAVKAGEEEHHELEDLLQRMEKIEEDESIIEEDIEGELSEVKKLENTVKELLRESSQEIREAAEVLAKGLPDADSRHGRVDHGTDVTGGNIDERLMEIQDAVHNVGEAVEMLEGEFSDLNRVRREIEELEASNKNFEPMLAEAEELIEGLEEEEMMMEEGLQEAESSQAVDGRKLEEIEEEVEAEEELSQEEENMLREEEEQQRELEERLEEEEEAYSEAVQEMRDEIRATHEELEELEDILESIPDQLRTLGANRGTFSDEIQLAEELQGEVGTLKQEVSELEEDL